MRRLKYQRGVNVFELLLVLAALGSASYVAKHVEIESPVLLTVAVALSFLVYFLPSIFYFIEDRRKRRKEKPKSIGPK